MESIIYVVEATAMNEGVHLIKQWIYDGTAQILVPCCTLNAIEEAYKHSITPKDASNKQQNRQSGRPARQEQPLFDINPRTAWAFIERAQSEAGIVGVQFQKDTEMFTQWKDEEERAAKAETPLPPPSSFADALLRKLTIGDQKEEVKGPGKPKLTARNKATKSAWKIDKVPVVPSEGLDESKKSLFSCLLWFVYEAEKNPLQPVKYVLLANDLDVMKQATFFGLATATVHQVRERLLEERREHDLRNVKGLVEVQFPEILAMSQAFGTGSPDELEAGSADFDFLKPQDLEASAPSNDSRNEYDMDKADNLTHSTVTVTSILDDDIVSSQLSANSSEALCKNSSSVSQQTDNTSSVEPIPSLASRSQNEQKSNSAQDVLEALQNPKSPGLVLPAKEIPHIKDDSSELESDEEIIVFNPRNKRTSGLAGSNSRPGSSGSFVQKTYKGGVQTNSRPNTSAGLLSLDGQIESIILANGGDSVSEAFQADLSKTHEASSGINLKTPIESKLKAQSPVFTPGRPFISASLGTNEKVEIEQTSPAFQNRITPPTGPRIPSTPNSPGSIQHKNNGQDLLRIQQETSQRIIQRQRNAIQRQVKVVETGTKHTEQPSPRLIQMEPTDNPTIIDPDAFDRSYVVQPPSKPATRQGAEKRRPRGNAPRSTKENPKQKENTVESPRQNGHVAEPDVEYVLKSGSPRSSTRGRGKLWTP